LNAALQVQGELFTAILRLDARLPEDTGQGPVIAAVWDRVEAIAPLGPG
jgi:hypothetical protein